MQLVAHNLKRLLFLVATLLVGLLVVSHQTTLLVHLTVGQCVLVAFVWVIATFELDADRRTDQFQDSAVSVFQVTHVGLGHLLDLITMDHDNRRVGTTQVGVTQFDPAVVDHRRGVLAHGVFEDLGQAVGRPTGNRRLVRVLYGGVEVAYARTVQCRDKVDIGEVDEEQTTGQLDLDEVARSGSCRPTC